LTAAETAAWRGRYATPLRRGYQPECPPTAAPTAAADLELVGVVDDLSTHSKRSVLVIQDQEGNAAAPGSGS